MVNYHLSTGRINPLPGNELTAKTLGYAGLIPFLIFSIGSWTTLPYIADSTQILISYAAIILSFMGAIHWGATISNAARQHSKNLVVSVMPAIAAWLALLSPEIFALIILLVGFILLICYDLAVAKSQALPNWYISMRIRLTFIVTLCLAGAFIAATIN